MLALEQVTHHDSPQRRGSRGGHSTNDPAHAHSVSAPPRPETDSTHPDAPALAGRPPIDAETLGPAPRRHHMPGVTSSFLEGIAETHREAIAAVPARGPIEQTHVVEAFTLELGKVHEQGIKERELQVLASVDTDLCEQVAAALNPPAPKGKPAEDVTVSPVLVQILAEPGRVGGRKIGIIANAGSDLAGISKLV